MKKYNPFETIEEKIQKHIIIAILVIAFMLSSILTFIIIHKEESYKIEKINQNK